MNSSRRRRRRAHTADEAAAMLRKAWCRQRLSARDQARVPPWDAVVLTAASPEQAALYDRQLARARCLGRFPPSTAALAVPDPDAARIGSGAATLHAVASLARHLLSQSTKEEIAEFLLPEANAHPPKTSLSPPWSASWPPSTCSCSTPAATARGFRGRTPCARCRCSPCPRTCWYATRCRGASAS